MYHDITNNLTLPYLTLFQNGDSSGRYLKKKHKVQKVYRVAFFPSLVTTRRWTSLTIRSDQL
jgi:hypothetical protein